MHVLFFTNIPSPYRVHFFSELGKKCDLTVVYERKNASDRNASWRANGLRNYQEAYLKGVSIGADNSFCPEVLLFLKQHYDVVVIGMYSTYTAMLAMAWMQLKHVPYVISVDGGFVKNESKLKRKMKTLCLSSAKYWFSTGEASKSYLEYYGAKSKLIFNYPFTSVDQSDILDFPLTWDEKKSLRKKMGITAKKVVVSVGQFIPRKGFDILLKACLNFSDEDCAFLIIGGSRGEFCSKISSDIPNNVFILPFMEKEHLFQYYYAADFMVFPTREDIWGLVVNEAMACGLPVITTKCCGAGLELVKNGKNGFLIEPDSEVALTNAICRMLTMDNLDSFGEYSLSIIKDYTYQTMATRYYNVLKSEK